MPAPPTHSLTHSLSFSKLAPEDQNPNRIVEETEKSAAEEPPMEPGACEVARLPEELHSLTLLQVPEDQNPNRIVEETEQSAAEEPPMEPGACEIARLPEELLSAALSRTSPRDACRAALVSPAFRAAADSDAVWACFLNRPRDLPPLADGELPSAASSSASPTPRKKDLFLRLFDGPVLLSDKLMSMWLDRETGARCYMLSARALSIVWGDTPQYWSWIPLTDSRFSEGAQLIDVCWLEIRGKIPWKMLSDTFYATYIVFKVDKHSRGLVYPLQDATVSVGEINFTCNVCFKGHDDDEGHGGGGVPFDYWGGEPLGSFPRQTTRLINGRVVCHDENVALPQKRADGWMELELGEFPNMGRYDEDGEVSFSLMETKGGKWKSGLIVQGIEVRRKKRSKKRMLKLLPLKYYPRFSEYLPLLL